MSDETEKRTTEDECPEGASGDENEDSPADDATDETPEEEAAASEADEDGEPDRWSYESLGASVRKGFDQAKDTARTLAQDAMGFLGGRAWQPSVDLYVEGSQVILLADLPGVEPQDIDVVATPNAVTVRGRVSPGSEPSEELVYYERRRRSGEFKREVSLPAAVDSDNVKAKLCRGVLEVRMAVMPETTVKPEKAPLAADEPEPETDAPADEEADEADDA